MKKMADRISLRSALYSVILSAEDLAWWLKNLSQFVNLLIYQLRTSYPEYWQHKSHTAHHSLCRKQAEIYKYQWLYTCKMLRNINNTSA